ncbi:MAG: Sec-independent protein translocase protein TatA [Candidatus Roizmanbacteria bacterium GW2011_GWA2_35_19]|uniref:Sec-independent protein translocase protein TatA n=1 Tax=Candidatus Roizmanbacteria bacterium GW2011_GWA2_35_19 TaxID=1618478 RepID=A0A0G0BSX2_9BACT|nr:MAG: Sec-independent protein translocase protein TatA [Candidatus Roizmanbacteria bacterium GW2011_GWA2_35_19]
MFGNIGMTELTAISLIIIVLFGAKKIPEFVRGIGQAIKEFKKASK